MEQTSSFTWPNQDQTLIASGETDYVWVPQPPAVSSPLARDRVGRGELTGLVACGDALDAVQSLAQAGRLSADAVRLLYVDPPFGTGKRFGHYNDRLAEAAWLSMLQDRLTVMGPYLAANASVWVHLDETMSHKARLVLDHVFGSDAYVATVIWQKRLSVESRVSVSTGHDPILVYAPAGPKAWRSQRNRVPGGAAGSNRDGDPRGPWRDAPFTAPGYRPAQQYVIVNPAGTELLPSRGRSWFATEPVFRRMLAEDRIWWTKDGAGQPRIKNFDIDGLQVPSTIWSAQQAGTNDDAKRHLATLFPDAERLFDTPKPEQLLRRILQIASNPGELVVDLFAGSGSTATTAHKLGRRWIVSERLPSTVEEVLVPRLRRVIAGDDPGGITHDEAWSGGGAFDVVDVPARVGAQQRLSA